MPLLTTGTQREKLPYAWNVQPIKSKTEVPNTKFVEEELEFTYDGTVYILSLTYLVPNEKAFSTLDDVHKLDVSVMHVLTRPLFDHEEKKLTTTTQPNRKKRPFEDTLVYNPRLH